MLACGIGYHNWHHALPRDSALSESGIYNPTKLLIDASACIGLLL
jgi:hypothetical protein